MVRLFLIGAALVAASAALAHEGAITEETREHRAQIVETGVGHQGREYMSNGVLVIEGAPRWSEIRQRNVSRRFETLLEPLIEIYD